MAGDKNRVTRDVTTGIGTLSFPRVFSSTAGKNDKGEVVYDIQILLPKSDREGIQNLLRAIQAVGKAKWGDNWKRVRQPLRDGDKEKNELAEDGSTKGEKYPERLGCYFINARSSKPVGVYDRQRNVINNPDDLYGGCKGKINVTFYPYNTSGNQGIGAALNGVQKIADGEAFGSAKPSVETMFDMLDDEDEDGLEDADEFDGLEDEVEEEPAPAPAKKTAAKKATPAKKTAAKKPAPVEEVEIEEDEDDLYADLDLEDDDV
jgi:hypothetical protein